MAVALVMSDHHEPWKTAEDFGQDEPPYNQFAVALAARYAVRHCHDLRVYQFALKAGRQSKASIACAHPTLGQRAIPWCKILAVAHTLQHQGRPPTRLHDSWLYAYAVYLDSDVVFYDTSRSIITLLSEFSDSSEFSEPTSRQVAHAAPGGPHAWFASNHPFMPHAGTFVLDAPGRAMANSALFILRNIAASHEFLRRWWDERRARPYHTLPWYEQVALALIWDDHTRAGRVALLNGSRGLWRHALSADMATRRHQQANAAASAPCLQPVFGRSAHGIASTGSAAPTWHIDSHIRPERLPIMKKLLYTSATCPAMGSAVRIEACRPHRLGAFWSCLVNRTLRAAFHDRMSSCPRTIGAASTGAIMLINVTRMASTNLTLDSETRLCGSGGCVLTSL